MYRVVEVKNRMGIDRLQGKKYQVHATENEL
jgi:hypothetical protein